MVSETVRAFIFVFNVFFVIQKLPFLRFFELLHTFSRRLVIRQPPPAGRVLAFAILSYM